MFSSCYSSVLPNYLKSNEILQRCFFPYICSPTNGGGCWFNIVGSCRFTTELLGLCLFNCSYMRKSIFHYFKKSPNLRDLKTFGCRAYPNRRSFQRYELAQRWRVDDCRYLDFSNDYKWRIVNDYHNDKMDGCWSLFVPLLINKRLLTYLVLAGEDE